ncbi:sulfate adenylyltransferase subunit 1 [Spirochaetota bacterium]
MDTLKFVITGHVDHGKSTLIGRLLYDTGSLPEDRLEEIKSEAQNAGKEAEFAHLLDHLRKEREEGITVDTTQVFFRTENRNYMIIDAPGHVEFIKNMVTGASRAEAGVLIIDAHEGAQEQTFRHAYILSFLGIKHVIVVINKMDLIAYDEKKYTDIMSGITRFLEELDISAQDYIPVSAKKGENITERAESMEWYTGPCFIEGLDSLPGKSDGQEKGFIMPVQDIYTMGKKKVIAGRIESGSVSKGNAVTVLPGNNATAIRSIVKSADKVKRAGTGENIGLIMKHAFPVSRGNIISKKGDEAELWDSFHAWIFWMAEEDLDMQKEYTIRIATQRSACTVAEIKKRIDSSTLSVIEENASMLKHLDVGEVIITLKHPLAAESFSEIPSLGRFVLTDRASVAAGGTIS